MGLPVVVVEVFFCILNYIFDLSDSLTAFADFACGTLMI